MMMRGWTLAQEQLLLLTPDRKLAAQPSAVPDYWLQVTRTLNMADLLTLPPAYNDLSTSPLVRVVPGFISEEVGPPVSVVFSEIWYGPDWKASIDGQPVEHVRANYVLRGLAVPAGEHKVVFKLESQAYNASQPIALAGSILVLLLVLGVGLMELRPGKSTAPPTEE